MEQKALDVNLTGQANIDSYLPKKRSSTIKETVYSNSNGELSVSNSNQKFFIDQSYKSHLRKDSTLKQDQTHGTSSDQTNLNTSGITEKLMRIGLKSREDVDLNTPLADLLWSNPISEEEAKEEIVRQKLDDLSFQKIKMETICKPSSNKKSTGWRFSPEGIGFGFQKQITQQFLADNNYDLIIRGHSFCPDGIQIHHDQKIISIFSATNFGFRNNKRGGLVFIENANDENDTEVRLTRFSRLEKLQTFPEPHISPNIDDVLF